LIFRRNGNGEKKWSVSESPEWVCAKFKFTNGTVLRYLRLFLEHRDPKVTTRGAVMNFSRGLRFFFFPGGLGILWGLKTP